MGLFDIFKKKNEPQITLKDLIVADYEQQYLEECKYIWKNYVPENGQSEVLQGELLREIEKLRNEAKDNGNINWDMDFSYFCENIKWKLSNMSIYTQEELLKINLVMDYLKYTGEYASSLGNGADVMVNSIAYTKDNLYDIVADAIGKLQSVHPDSIPCDINYAIRR